MRNNLKEARNAKGMTQQQVADHLGISLRYYQNLEAGDRGGDRSETSAESDALRQ